MVKLIVLYREPPNPEEFESYFRSTHLPLFRAYPGLKRLEATRIEGVPPGEARFFMMVEASFDDRHAIDAATSSSAGKALSRDLLRFAPDAVVFHGIITDAPLNS
jgi:uncharacterized protein (TIGR02118 family)